MVPVRRRLTIRLPGVLANRLTTLARKQGLSLNNYMTHCLECETSLHEQRSAAALDDAVIDWDRL